MTVREKDGKFTGTVIAPFKAPLYDLSALSKETWNTPRPCWYCSVAFVPSGPRHWRQHFCSDQHRAAFSKYGYLPYDKLILALRDEVTRQVEQKFSAIALEEIGKLCDSNFRKRIRTGEIFLRRYIRDEITRRVPNAIEPEETIEDDGATGAAVYPGMSVLSGGTGSDEGEDD